ncbi:MAG: hypothetical protein V1696_02265 [Candidatus Jorgensenbacteria bacterium]
MKNQIVRGVVAGMVAFSVAFPAFAVTTSTPLRGVKGDLIEKFKQERTMLRDEVKNFVASSTAAAREQLRAKREELQKLMVTQREEFKKAVEAKREEVKQAIEVKRAELKDRVKILKDVRREQLVAKIYDDANALNKRLTDHFLALLDKIDAMLGKVESRADKAATNGREVGAVRSAVANAENAIAAARTAVGAQAGKVYMIAVNTSSSLKQDVQAVRNALHADFVTVRDAVKGARDAVQEAARVLAQVPRVDEETVATSTSKQE